MKRALAICVVAACGGGEPVSPMPDAPAAGDGPAADAPRFDPLDGAGTVELVQGGYQFTEGPQWRDAGGDLVFSAPTASRSTAPACCSRPSTARAA
jgi:hypothetical protein